MKSLGILIYAPSSKEFVRYILPPLKNFLDSTLLIGWHIHDVEKTRQVPFTKRMHVKLKNEGFSSCDFTALRKIFFLNYHRDLILTVNLQKILYSSCIQHGYDITSDIILCFWRKAMFTGSDQSTKFLTKRLQLSQLFSLNPLFPLLNCISYSKRNIRKHYTDSIGRSTSSIFKKKNASLHRICKSDGRTEKAK